MVRRAFPGLVLLTSMAFAISVQAQIDLQNRFSGYLEHQFSLTRTGDEWRQIDYDRLRADLDMRTRQGSRASVGVIYQLYRGDTRFDASDYLPQGIVIPGDSLAISLKNRNYLNHAYIALRKGRIELTLGKQYLTWGAGWVFNPTELFRPKNALEPSYDREGVGAISARVALGSLSDILFGYIPEGRLSESGKVVRLRHHLSGFDISGLVASRAESSISVSGGKPEQRTLIGGDISGEILGLGIWMEATWSDLDDVQWTEATLGGNYTFSDGTLVLIEGYFNGRGKSASPYSAQDWLDRLYGNRLTLGKTTLVGAVNRTIAQLWSVGISAISNPGDGSFVLVPSVSYSFADNIDLLFNGLIYLGASGDEYGADQTGGFVRARLYF